MARRRRSISTQSPLKIETAGAFWNPTPALSIRSISFVRGCLEIPVIGATESFAWGVWVSLSKDHFDDFLASFDAAKRSHIGPFFGWLSAEFPFYPSAENLKTRAHLRDHGVRPYI